LTDVKANRKGPNLVLRLDLLLLQKDIPNDPKLKPSGYQRFLEQFDNGEGQPYIHPRTVTYRNASERASWYASAKGPNREDLQEYKKQDTFAEFWKTRKDGKKFWLACFSSPNANWVAKSSTEWEEID
jgi:hypothetical protein